MILIVGCGFFGQYVLREILPKTDERIVCTYHSDKPALKFEPPDNVIFKKCDVTNEKDLFKLNEYCADEVKTVFYFAASHNIDFVFKKPDKARKVNIDGLNLFLETVKGIKSFFFASTDCVYGESKPGQAPFKETDKCEPINEYGRQKLEAENLVLKADFNVFRFSLLYGTSLCKKQSFYDKTFSKLKKGESVEMIYGLSRNALTYKQAAQMIVKLATDCKNIPQILNVAGDKLITKYDLGLRIAADAGAAPALVKPISEVEGQKFFAEKRAGAIRMENSLLKKACF